jgi:hypothetical protein
MVLLGKTERKKQLGIPRCRWEDHNAVDLKGIKYGLRQEPVATFCEHDNIPAGFIHFAEFLDELRNY